jgi:HemX protein
MPSDRFFIYLATVFFCAGFALAFLALRTGRYRPSSWNLVVMGLGFASQCAFLALRGKVVRQCPVTNQFEVLVFVAWAMALLYFLIGTSYRWSLLGMFTAPLAFLLQVMALLSPDPAAGNLGRAEFWNELHKTVSLLGYGAFALSSVAAVMFLVQDRQLRKQRLQAWFHHLPPIHFLQQVMRRLNLFGLVCLTLGIISAWKMNTVQAGHSLVAVYIIWGLYAALIIYEYTRGMSARRSALASMGAFAVPLLTLWIFAH